jgi:hypothetical protein
MTVKELIEKLQMIENQNIKVIFNDEVYGLQDIVELAFDDFFLTEEDNSRTSCCELKGRNI